MTHEFNLLAELIGVTEDKNFQLNLFPERYEAGTAAANNNAE